MMAKVDVNGANTHPLFHYLKSLYPGPVKWNFDTHFLVARNGTVLCPSVAHAPFSAPLARAHRAQGDFGMWRALGEARHRLFSQAVELVTSRWWRATMVSLPPNLPPRCVYVCGLMTPPLAQKVRTSTCSLSYLSSLSPPCRVLPLVLIVSLSFLSSPRRLGCAPPLSGACPLRCTHRGARSIVPCHGGANGRRAGGQPFPRAMQGRRLGASAAVSDARKRWGSAGPPQLLSGQSRFPPVRLSASTSLRLPASNLRPLACI